jgi:hypothetical protein
MIVLATPRKARHGDSKQKWRVEIVTAGTGIKNREWTIVTIGTVGSHMEVRDILVRIVRPRRLCSARRLQFDQAHKFEASALLVPHVPYRTQGDKRKSIVLVQLNCRVSIVKP